MFGVGLPAGRPSGSASPATCCRGTRRRSGRRPSAPRSPRRCRSSASRLLQLLRGGAGRHRRDAEPVLRDARPRAAPRARAAFAVPPHDRPPARPGQPEAPEPRPARPPTSLRSKEPLKPFFPHYVLDEVIAWAVSWRSSWSWPPSCRPASRTRRTRWSRRSTSSRSGTSSAVYQLLKIVPAIGPLTARDVGILAPMVAIGILVLPPVPGPQPRSGSSASGPSRWPRRPRWWARRAYRLGPSDWGG